MRFGVTFPQTEIGNDAARIRDFFQVVEDLGYDFVTLPEHVLGAGTSPHDDWRAYYTRDNAFHEPFVLYGFAAALTKTLELATAILVLPQRQAVLAAKQAAELDVLSGGRVRLGVGLGWNEIEFEALGQNFSNRSRRLAEQVEVMRSLWSNELTTYRGEWHTLNDVGLNPMPVQRPIPVWIGAFQPPAVRRAARIGDGWIMNPRMRPEDLARDIAGFREAAEEAGRDPAKLGLEATIWAHEGEAEDWRRSIEQWRQHGVSHVTFRTMQSNLGLDEHVGKLEGFARVMGAYRD